jgi:pimeloyl-ACP methyl ester carboxylesterase
MNLARFAAAALIAAEAPAARAREISAMNANQYRKSRKYAALHNCRIAYIERGRGSAALFLHGFPLNGFQWRGIIPRLSKHRRCIAPDFMGLGYTETAEHQEISPETQAEMLAQFLDELKIKTVDVIANDTGGEIAQLFVARFPDRVRTLLLSNCDVDTNSPPASFKPILAAAQKGVLADGFARLAGDKALARSPRGLGAFYTNPADLTDEAIEYYLSPLISTPLRKTQLNSFAASFAHNPLIAIEAALKRCPAPVRIVWATADTTFDVAWADWLDKSFPHSRGIRRVEGAKLFFPEEMPDLFAEESLKLWNA